MGFKRANLDKWLMAVAIGALMVVAGLSSTDKGWAVIGAAILVVALLIGALEVYGWTRRSRGKSTELPTPVVVVLCLIAIPVLAVYGFDTGSGEAVIVAGMLVVLLILLFLLRNAPPIKIAEFSTGDVQPLSPTHDETEVPLKVTIGDKEIPVTQTEVKFSFPLDVAMKASGLPFFEKEGSYLRGIVHAVKGDTDAALEAFRAYAGETGDASELAVGRAVALISGRRYDEALTELDRSLAEQPSGIARLLRGQVLLTIGANDEALADIEAAAQDGRVSGVKGMLGAAYLEAGRLSEAITALKEASSEMTATSGTLFTLGEAYRLSGRKAEATNAYDDAAARAIVDAQYAVASDRGILPMALARQDKFDSAQKAVDELIAMGSDDPSLWIARALIEVKRGTPTFAASDLEEAMKANPHAVVKALEDPDFASLITTEAFQSLLERAKAGRERMLARVRQREGGPA